VKKLLLAVVVLAAFGAAASVVYGNLQAHAAHRGLLEGVQQDGTARIVEESFTPGLLDASSLVRFELASSGDAMSAFLGGEEGGESPAFGFRMQSHIEHGARPLLRWLGEGREGTPVLGQIHTEFALDGVAAAKVGEVLGELPPLEIDTTVRASGVSDSVIRARPHKGEGVASMGAFTFDWKGLDGKLVFTEDLGQVAGKFTAGGLEIDAGLVRLGLSGFEGTLDSESHDSGLPIGSWLIRLASFEFEPTLLAGPSLSLSDWKMTQESRVEDGRYDLAVSHAIERVTVGDDDYGPATLDFGIRNVDAASFGELRTALTGARGGNLDEEAQAALVGTLQGLLPTLVVHSPEVELSEFRVTTPQGLVRGDLKFVLAGDQAEMLANPMTAPAAIQADASAELPAATFAALVDIWASKQLAARAESGELSVGEDAAETLAYVRDSLIHNLRKSGYVVFDGERYTTQLSWREGSLKLNGLPVNPLELSALAGGGGGAGGGLTFPEQTGPEDAFGTDSLPARLGE